MYDKEKTLTAEELLIEARNYPEDGDARALIRQMTDSLKGVEIAEFLIRKKTADEPFPADELDSFISHDEHFESRKEYFQKSWNTNQLEDFLHLMQKNVSGLTDKGNHLIDFLRYRDTEENYQRLRRRRFVGTVDDFAIYKDGVETVWDHLIQQFVPENDKSNMV